MPGTYIGRFAPSPTGPLHLGSMACALASWLDARAHGGEWLVRIEDIDPPRDVPGADREILALLGRFALDSDREPVWQSRRSHLYEAALEKLSRVGRVYGCACTRSEIAAANAAAGLPTGVYPGTCRNGTQGRTPRALRFRTDSDPITFVDRLAGAVTQNVEREVGDFVVRRADGLWAYQLAVTVDDFEQGITHVVRGADLLDNTARQIALQRALGLPTPVYMHIPLVVDAAGAKLSKQTKAAPVAGLEPLSVLERLWTHFGFPAMGADSLQAFLHTAVELWRERFVGGLAATLPPLDGRCK